MQSEKKESGKNEENCQHDWPETTKHDQGCRFEEINTITTPNVEPLIDAKAAGRLLHLHPKTVKKMAAKGQLPALRIGNRWRFRASELDAWARAKLQSNCHLHPPHQEEIK